MTLAVNTAQLLNELETLAAFSDAPAPAVTRVVFSETDRRARGYVKEICTSAGLAVREDAVGNTFARWSGAQPELPAIGTGSHIDAIPNAGRYDGTVGVLGVVTAIAAPASLRIWVEGEGGHAGAVLMPQRRDALCAAAEIALAVESAARSTGSIDTVGTTGVCDVFPGAINSIPVRVRLE